MLFSDITIVDENFEVKDHQWVGVSGSAIDYLGDSAPEQDFGEVYDGAGKILIPGMYNAHTHVPMTLLRGYAENLPLQAWLNDMVWPFEEHIDDDTAYPATQLAIAEMLRTGTVSFTDMYYQSDMRAKAVLESGIKCNLSEGLIGFDDTPYNELPTKENNEHLIAEYNGAGDGRLLVDVCIHAEYTTNPELVEAIGQVAYDNNIGTHIHISETSSEHEECKQRRGGLSPAAYFESLGFFRAPCTAAHAVYAEPSDWEIFVKNNVTVASCPVSNLKLASGVAPVPAMIDAGVNVALGTDGVASNNNHDLMQDMYVLALVHKGVSGDPTLITAAQALKCATVNGALSQRRMSASSGMRRSTAPLDDANSEVGRKTDTIGA